MNAPNAKAINIEAAAWIERRDRADWHADDQVHLDIWLAQSTAHFIAYHRMRDAWERSEKLIILRRQSTPQVPAGRSYAPFVFKTTIAVATLAILGAAAFLLDRSHDRIYVTAVGEHQMLKLSDGSKIELNTDTAIRVAQSGRNVTLERGEAFFQVQHNETHPFVVIVGDRRITDIGTKFNVRRDSDRLEVVLVEGSARVDVLEANAARSTVLTPGDVLVANARFTSVVKRPAASVADALEWRRDLIVFNQTALADAAAEINRYNRKKIVIADSGVAKKKIGGTFPVNGTAQLTEVVRDLFKLRVEDRGDEVIISR